MSNSRKHFYEFGPFRLYPAERRLRRGEEVLPLTPKAFEVLLLLVRGGGDALSKDDFFKRVWEGEFVEEKNLSEQVSQLRRVLADRKPYTFIETVTGHGYRFAAEVREVEEEGADVLLAERERGRLVIEGEDGDARPGETQAAREVETRPAAPALPTRRGKVWPKAAALGAACAVLAAAAYYFALRPGAGRAAVGAQQFRSLAVLPLKPLGGAPAGDDAYLGPGLADALITKLSNVRQIAVRPTSAVLKYAGPQADLAAVAREQQVDAVLDGSFQRAGDRVRVTVQLVRGVDAAPLWADTFDATFTDIFAVQDEISRRVAESLSPRLTGEERSRLAKRPTENAEAHQLYLTGRYFWNKRTKDDLLKAADYFRRALEKDPSYALAHAGLADTYYVLAFRKEMPEQETYALAKRAAERALELDDQLAEAHTSLARLKGVYERDAAASEREFKTAIGLNPNYATAHHWYSRLLVQLGRVEEGLAEARRAYELDPLSLIVNNNLGELLYQARRYDESLAHLRKIRELDPNFGRVNIAVFFYFNYLRKGMYEEACREFAASLRLGRAEEERFAAQLIDAYRAGGERAIWRKQVELLPKVAAGDQHFPVHMAEAYAWLGEKEQALEWLGRAADARHPGMMFLRTDPDFEFLHDDPRFADLVRRVDLP